MSAQPLHGSKPPQWRLATELCQEGGTIPLFVFTYLLSHIPLNTLKTKGDFIQALKGRVHTQIDTESFKIWSKYCSDLIFLQSPDIETFAVLELISNGQDANKRAKRPTAPVEITYKDNTLTIRDYGDGIGWAQIQTYKVPIFTSNQAGNHCTTGQFGIGGKMSQWSLLLYAHSPVRSPPAFSTHGLVLTLEEIIFIDGEEHIITATAYFDRTDVSLKKIESKQLKGRVTSFRSGERLNIKLFGKQGEPCTDIKENSKLDVGTHVKLCSPLFAQLPLAQTVKEKFAYFPSTMPLIFNGEKINSAEGLKGIIFKGGMLKYRRAPVQGTTPFDDLKVSCTLSICEKGRTIKQYHHVGYALPTEMAIDFDDLTLSQDRNSLDLSSPDLKKVLETIITKLLKKKNKKHSLLTSLLINALYPLVSEPTLGLISYIHHELTTWEPLCFPALREFVLHSAPECYYLHPEYIPPSFFKTVHHIHHSRIYLVEQPKVIHPLAITTIKEKHYLFVDASLVRNLPPWLLFLNIHLIDEYYKLKTSKSCANESLAHIENFYLSPPPLTPTTPLETKDFPLPLQEAHASEIAWSNWQQVATEIEGGKLLTPEVEVCMGNAARVFSEDETPLLLSECKTTLRWKFRYFLTSVKNQILLVRHLPIDFWKTLTYIFFINSPKQESLTPVEFLHQLTAYFTQLEAGGKARFAQFLLLNKGNKRLGNEISFQKIKNHFEKLEFLLSLSGYGQTAPVNHPTSTFMRRFHLQVPYQTLLDVENLLNKLSPLAQKHFIRCAVWFSFDGLKQFEIHKWEAILTLLNGELIDNFENAMGLVKQPWQNDHTQNFNWIDLHRLEEMHDLAARVSKNKKEALICLIAIIKLKHSIKIRNSNKAFIQDLAEIYSKDRPFSVDYFIKTVRQLQTFETLLDVNDDFLNYLWEEGADFTQQCLKSTKQELLTLVMNAIDENEADGEAKDAYRKEATKKVKSPVPEFPNITIYHALQYGQKLNLAKKKLKKSAHSEEASTQYSLALLNFIEAAQLIPDKLKKTIYIALLGDANSLELGKMNELPGMNSQPLFLHDYLPFQAVHGSRERCEMAIQKSIDQNLDNHFFIQELIKNSMEAHATKIYITTGQVRGKLGIGIEDNGIGMDAIGADALVITSKSTKENQNHGVGFYSCLKKSERARVITSQGKGEFFVIDLQKTENGLLFTKDAYKGHGVGAGTKILLIQPPAINLMIDYLLFKSILTSVCRELKEIDIYLNDVKITQNHTPPPYLTLSKSYQSELGEEHPVTLKMVYGAEGGVYRNHLKIAPVDAKYLEWIPQEIMELIQEDHLSFKIFLTQNRQIINRAGFAHQHALDTFLQQLCYEAAQNYVFLHLLEGKTEKMLSSIDVCSDFRYHFNHGAPQSTPALDPRKKELVRTITSYLGQLSQQGREVAFALKPNVRKDPAQWGRWVLEADGLKHMKQKENFKEFVTKCLALPLGENGRSMLEVRELWKEHLSAPKWLLDDGSYNYLVIGSLSKPKVTDLLEQISRDLTQKLGQVYSPVITSFKNSIKDRIHVILDYSLYPNKEPDPLTLIFFKELAQSIGLSVEATFFSAPNGWIAYAQGKTIFINLKTKQALISEIKAAYLESGKKWEIVMKKYAFDLRKWVSTLAHECTHILEGTGCESPHGPWFDDKWAMVEAQLLRVEMHTLLEKLFNS